MNSNINYFKKRLKAWTYPRLLQLGIGFFVLTSGLVDGALGIATIGAIIGLLSVFNVGCGVLSRKTCNENDCN